MQHKLVAFTHKSDGLPAFLQSATLIMTVEDVEPRVVQEGHTDHRELYLRGLEVQLGVDDLAQLILQPHGNNSLAVVRNLVARDAAQIQVPCWQKWVVVTKPHRACTDLTTGINEDLSP